ncbi:MAG: hypothetical protein DDT29_02465 [Dehalococcoidia bacterium]|nr:hypothetical protein [Bacillota bacterium]
MKDKDQLWICTHPELMEEYRGEYIAVVNGEVVAHGTILEQVINKAKVYDPDSLIAKIPSEEVLVV